MIRSIAPLGRTVPILTRVTTVCGFGSRRTKTCADRMKLRTLRRQGWTATLSGLTMGGNKMARDIALETRVQTLLQSSSCFGREVCRSVPCACAQTLASLPASPRGEGVVETATQANSAHKVMTAEEYAAMPLQGWHEVCRNVDGFGGVGVRFLTHGGD